MHTKFIKGCASDKNNITLPPDPWHLKKKVLRFFFTIGNAGIW